VRSYRTISPLPAARITGWLRRYHFCGTFHRLAPPRRYLAPCPMEPGLSSTLARSDCLADSQRYYTCEKARSSRNFSGIGGLFTSSFRFRQRARRVRLGRHLWLERDSTHLPQTCSQSRLCGHGPVFAPGTIHIWVRPEPIAEIGTLLAAHFFSTLFTALAGEAPVVARAQSAGVQVCGHFGHSANRLKGSGSPASEAPHFQQTSGSAISVSSSASESSSCFWWRD
jgi:hypothetical protein